MRLSHKIILASNNPDKCSEFQSLFNDMGPIELIPASQLIRNSDKLAYAEVHNSYLENAIAKARLANQGAHYPALGDDTGLEVGALDGRPGIKSFRYAKVAGKSLSRIEQNQANNELLLSELKGKSDRTARFVTTVALVIEGLCVHATGLLEGTILDSPRGTMGFGYDALFLPKGSQKTLAEMSAGEKNAISHRGKALRALMAEIQARGVVFAKP